MQVRVGVRPDPIYTLIDIDFAPFVTGQPPFATVHVTPRDRFGNVYLRDLASNPSLSLNVQNGSFSGPLVSLLNGTYTRPLVYTPGATPTITLQVDGQDVITSQPVAPALDLSYADTVLEFKQAARPGRAPTSTPTRARRWAAWRRSPPTPSCRSAPSARSPLA